MEPNLKPGDQIVRNGRIFTLSKNYKPYSPLIDCVDAGGSGFTLFRNEVQRVPDSASPSQEQT